MCHIKVWILGFSFQMCSSTNSPNFIWPTYLYPKPEACRILIFLSHPPPTAAIDFTDSTPLRYSCPPDWCRPPPGHPEPSSGPRGGHLVASLLPTVSLPASGSSSQSSPRIFLKPDSYSVPLLRSLRRLFIALNPKSKVLRWSPRTSSRGSRYLSLRSPCITAFLSFSHILLVPTALDILQLLFPLSGMRLSLLHLL